MAQVQSPKMGSTAGTLHQVACRMALRRWFGGHKMTLKSSVIQYFGVFLGAVTTAAKLWSHRIKIAPRLVSSS